MKTRNSLTAEKLRGGFYTPDPLVDLCLERISVLTRGASSLHVLEPSAGDGAFVRGIARNRLLFRRVDTMVAIEALGSEARKCASEMQRNDLGGRTRTTSAISWGATTRDEFDVAIGNPPFVRFQFVPEEDKESIGDLGQRLGLSFAGVSNLWLPVLLSALSRLTIGGAFAFVVPAECFTGVSAGVLRSWLVENTSALRFDLFPPGSFPEVLQEVVVLSGQRSEASGFPVSCEIREHCSGGTMTRTSHSIPYSNQSWTRYLLTHGQLGSFEEAASLGDVWALGNVAKFEVAAVTGANDYFSVSTETLDRFDLAEWAVPLLPRIRHAPGLRYTVGDHVGAAASGAKTHLLDFSSDRPDPVGFNLAAQYLAMGIEQGLPARFKCRTRTPWYRVPLIRPGRLMMSKRSHRYPRVVVNDIAAVTTDTIYRGTTVGFFEGREEDLAAGFHNSLTLLSAELEGRSFGGGVLELVPSEVSRLLVPMTAGFGAEIERLDALARTQSVRENQEALVHETDLLLSKTDCGLTTGLVDELRGARDSLLQRRLARTGS